MVRIGNPDFAPDGLEPLRRARRAADECRLPLMVHISFGPPPVENVLPFLKPGDIVTHCCTGHPMRLVDGEGRLVEAARRAWDSGVVMDVGHGTGSFSFETAEALLAQGRKPDTISTDLHQLSVYGPAFDLPTTLSKFLHIGMSLREVIEAATVRPAGVLGLEREVGTLRPGSRADIALFRLFEGDFPLHDIHGNMRQARRLLRNTLTIVGGRPLERRAPEPRAPWTDPIWPAAQVPFTEKQQALHDLGRTPDAMAAAAGEPS
jgi:dihydroorotase